MDSGRKQELAANLEALERRIEAACARAGRSRSELTVVAVTKTFPVEDVRLLAELGVRDIGENRDQDAAPKASACAAAGLTDLVWHFVGQLQTNKARSVAGYADVVHSVDRPRLVTALEKAATPQGDRGRTLTCLVQVDLETGRDAGRGGVAPRDVPAVAAALTAASHLRLGGVMAVAPLEGDPATAFTRLAEVSAALRATYPEATVVSAGMSGDLEAAVAHGATHLRVGTALLGSRPPLG